MVGGCDAVEKSGHESRETHGGGDADAYARCRHPQGVAKYEAHHFGTACPQRHAQPEFARPLINGEGDDPVDAERGEHQRGAGKDGQEVEDHAAILCCRRHAFVHRRDVVQGNVDAQGAHLVPGGSHQIGRNAVGSYRHGGVGKRLLAEWQVYLDGGPQVRGSVHDVIGDADDFCIDLRVAETTQGDRQPVA